MAVKTSRKTAVVIPSERVDQSILMIRGQKVMLDADLAEPYGVTTKRLNEQIERNRTRFPADFMFQLTGDEEAEAVANCDHLARLKFSPASPAAFNEHGAMMVASVLNSDQAVEMSIFVVRAFVRLGSDSPRFWVVGRQVADAGRKEFAGAPQLSAPRSIPSPSGRRRHGCREIQVRGWTR